MPIYRVDHPLELEKSLEIAPFAEIVRCSFEYTIDGVSQRARARQLNQGGMPPISRHLSHHSSNNAFSGGRAIRLHPTIGPCAARTPAFGVCAIIAHRQKLSGISGRRRLVASWPG